MIPSRDVRVGATPKPRYATWEEHREALRREAAAYREMRTVARTEEAANRAAPRP